MSCTNVDKQPCKEVELRCPPGQVIVGGDAYTGAGSRNYIYTISSIKCSEPNSTKTNEVNFSPLQFNTGTFNKVQLPTLSGGYNKIEYFQQTEGDPPNDQRASQIIFTNDNQTETPIGSATNPLINLTAKQCDCCRCWNPTTVYTGDWNKVSFECPKGKSLNRIRYAYRQDISNKLASNNIYDNLFAWSIINFSFDETDCIDNPNAGNNSIMFNPPPIYIADNNKKNIENNGGSITVNGPNVEITPPQVNKVPLVIFTIMLMIIMIAVIILFFFARV